VTMFIGVAKGELGDFFQKFLQARYGVQLEIDGPLTQWYETCGNRIKFRIQRSRDIPRSFSDEQGYSFGLTGLDVAMDEVYAEYIERYSDRFFRPNVQMTPFWDTRYFKIQKCLDGEARNLGFGNLAGRIAVLGTEEAKTKRDRLRVVVSDYYPNLAMAALKLLLDLAPDDYTMRVVEGSVEGYLSGDGYDLAVDTIYSGKTIGKENEESEKRGAPRIDIIKEICDTYPVIIRSMCTRAPSDFDNLFQ